MASGEDANRGPPAPPVPAPGNGRPTWPPVFALTLKLAAASFNVTFSSRTLFANSSRKESVHLAFW